MPRKRKSFLYVDGKGSSRDSKPRMNYSKRGLDFIVRVYRIAAATHGTASTRGLTPEACDRFVGRFRDRGTKMRDKSRG